MHGRQLFSKPVTNVLACEVYFVTHHCIQLADCVNVFYNIYAQADGITHTYTHVTVIISYSYCCMMFSFITENGMVCFESVKHPGQHLGIIEDGSVKPPGNTGKGKHGRFHIIQC